MSLVDEEESFLDDLVSMKVGWNPHIEGKTCDDEFYELTIEDGHIVRILIEDSEILSIPDSIANLTHLEEVVLYSNWFEKFPVEIFTLPKLKKFVSSNNRYPKIEFRKSSSLKALTIGDKIDFLPESIGKFSNLTNIAITTEKLTTLPESIGNFSNLETLELWGNKLTTLPDSIKNLRKVKYMSLRRNNLTTLPKAIGQMTSLKELIIRENKISYLPDSLGGCRSLKVIMAQKNKLTTVPASLNKLKKLRELNLNNNPITTLPEELGHLKNLKIIRLNRCKLKELPVAITKFKSLKYLNLNNNYLTTLPDSIKNLTSLETLDLVNNKFTELPKELNLLPSLNYIDLGFNPLPRKFRRTLRGKSLRIMLKSNNLKNEVDIENLLVEAIEQNSFGAFTTLIRYGILTNVNEAITKRIVLKAFEKGDVRVVRFLRKKGFALLFKEDELKKFIIDKKTSDV